MELDPHERWLMEMVAPLRYPLWVLGSPEIASHLNRAGHGLSVAELVPRLERLIEGGLIYVHEAHDGGITVPLSPSAAELATFVGDWSVAAGEDDQACLLSAAAGDDDIDVCFGLTAAGGAAWEAFAAPDWDRFLDDRWDEDHFQTVSATSRERALAMARVLVDDDPAALAAITWQSVAPWQATYWKALPSGVHCRVTSSSLRGGIRSTRELRRWFEPVVLPPRL